MTHIILTPQQIALLMKCHFSSPGAEADAETSNITERALLDNGLIEPDNYGTNRYFIPTEKGRVHIENLCQTPLPVQKWTVP